MSQNDLTPGRFEPNRYYPATDVLKVLPFKSTRNLRAWASTNSVTIHRFNGKTNAFLGSELNDALDRATTRPARKTNLTGAA